MLVQRNKFSNIDAWWGRTDSPLNMYRGFGVYRWDLEFTAVNSNKSNTPSIIIINIAMMLANIHQYSLLILDCYLLV